MSEFKDSRGGNRRGEPKWRKRRDDRDGRGRRDDREPRRASSDRGGERSGFDNDRRGSNRRRGERNDRRDSRFDGRSGRRRGNNDFKSRDNSGDAHRKGRRFDAKGRRPRFDEPEIPSKVSVKDLDAQVLAALHQLGAEPAERVAKHLVMAGSLLDVDAEAAYAHAQAAVKRASRIAEVREAAALAAYACGKYTEALREVRTARRLSGSDALRAVEADCERGLGRADRALEIIAETDETAMTVDERAELVIVASGARADRNQYEVGLLLIEDFLEANTVEDETLARLLAVKADRLDDLGRHKEAEETRAMAPAIPEAVSIVDLEEVVEAETDYVASDLHGSRKPLVEAYDLLLVDLDGVCYNGSQPIDHAAEGLSLAREAQIALSFVTNNASRTPRQVCERLAGVGIEASENEVMTAAMDGVGILTDKLPPASKVLVVGGEGLREAVTEAGFEVVANADDHPAAVIQGYDPSVGWAEMSEAAYAINAGALFVATNLDASLPTERGFAIGNGSLVACVQNATGHKPLAGGKPFASIYRRPVEQAGAHRPLAVGDRLNTDIRGARSAGYRSLLVLTGVTDARALALAEREERPDFIGLDLRSLAQAHPGVVKNPTGEWTSGDSAGFSVDGHGNVTREGQALGEEDIELSLPDFRAFIAAVWEARDNGVFVTLPKGVRVVDAVNNEDGEMDDPSGETAAETASASEDAD